MGDRVTVLVVGHRAVRAAVCSILDADGRIRVIAEAADGDEAVEAYRARPAQVVVICPQSTDGDSVDTARHIGDEAPDAKIIVLGRVRALLDGLHTDDSRTRVVRTEAAQCLTGVAVELGRR
jgi:DNA-binding NarL/FixJ family response regulator